VKVASSSLKNWLALSTNQGITYLLLPMSNTTKPHYIKASAIKKLVKSHGKRTANEFLLALDRFVQNKVEASCKEHNGGKKTLDAALAFYMMGL
jgi:hypothetical protein